MSRSPRTPLALNSNAQSFTGLEPASQEGIYLRHLFHVFNVKQEPSLAQMSAAMKEHPRARLFATKQHGVYSVGRTVGEAFTLMYLLDKAARVEVKARSFQGGYEARDTERTTLRTPYVEARALAFETDPEIPGHWEWPALVRMLQRDEPDYLS